MSKRILILSIGSLVVVAAVWFVLKRPSTYRPKLDAQLADAFDADLVTPTPKAKAQLTVRNDSDKNGDTIATPTMSPSVSPKMSPSVIMSPSVSPFAMVTPTLTPKPTVTPMVTPRATPTLTPSSTSSPQATPTVTPTPVPLSGRVVISEIAWMGTQKSASDEWIELYNPESFAIQLEGWTLKSETDNSPSLTLVGTILAGGYFIIERTDDTTVATVTADMVTSFGTGGLSNAGECLVLLDTSGMTKDRVNCAGAWFAGDNTSKATMERISSNQDGNQVASWGTSTGQTPAALDSGAFPILGTPGTRNSVGVN